MPFFQSLMQFDVALRTGSPYNLLLITDRSHTLPAYRIPVRLQQKKKSEHYIQISSSLPISQ